VNQSEATLENYSQWSWSCYRSGSVLYGMFYLQAEVSRWGRNESSNNSGFFCRV